MKTSMYTTSVPRFIRALNNLTAILEKGAAHAEAPGSYRVQLAPLDFVICAAGAAP